jgi:hypothetical protein
VALRSGLHTATRGWEARQTPAPKTQASSNAPSVTTARLDPDRPKRRGACDTMFMTAPLYKNFYAVRVAVTPGEGS